MLESLKPNWQWAHGNKYYMYICINFATGPFIYLFFIFPFSHMICVISMFVHQSIIYHNS